MMTQDRRNYFERKVGLYLPRETHNFGSMVSGIGHAISSATKPTPSQAGKSSFHKKGYRVK